MGFLGYWLPRRGAPAEDLGTFGGSMGGEPLCGTWSFFFASVFS